MKGNVNVMN